jgi:hypothetical protein
MTTTETGDTHLSFSYYKLKPVVLVCGTLNGILFPSLRLMSHRNKLLCPREGLGIITVFLLECPEQSYIILRDFSTGPKNQ